MSAATYISPWIVDHLRMGKPAHLRINEIHGTELVPATIKTIDREETWPVEVSAIIDGKNTVVRLGRLGGWYERFQLFPGEIP